MIISYTFSVFTLHSLPLCSHILDNMRLSLSIHLINLFLVSNFLDSVSTQDGKYNACSQRTQCGHLSDISYPFYDEETRPEYCGHPGFKLDCQHDGPQISISSLSYYLLSINDTVATVARTDIWQETCPYRLVNVTIDPSLYEFTSADQNITFFYDCTYGVSMLSVSCHAYKGLVMGYYMTMNMQLEAENSLDLWEVCKGRLSIPILKALESIFDYQAELFEPVNAFKQGFELEMIANIELCNECLDSGGQCGYDSGSTKFVCYCLDDNHGIKCGVNSDKGHSKISVAIGASIGALVLAAVLIGGCLLFIHRRRKQLANQEKARDIFPTPTSFSYGGSAPVLAPGSNGLTSSQAYTSTPSTNYSQSIPSYASSRSDIGTGSTYFGVRVFDYTELEQATGNFHDSRELGDGGFGTVYYGVLLDGRQVAVKRLYENSFKRVEQYMNEIRILAELRHQHLVALYGCTSRRSRELLLVYEYIPNGTVADHLHGKYAESTFLKWPIRLSIAVQTAQALAFLHQSKVIHRDVKTTNILLDNDFHVKVADFGLSRLFPTDMTHVSTAPQGTPGYVDPEYYQCYRLTEKSDVYSFGVVLIELISSKQAVDIARHRHDVNLANMAMDRIQNQALHELVDPRLGYDTDNTVQRMVKMVAELGFRCLQQDREMRPTMEEVEQALRGIQLEGSKSQKQEVMDIVIYEDEVGLLRNVTPPLSPELPRSNSV